MAGTALAIRASNMVSPSTMRLSSLSHLQSSGHILRSTRPVRSNGLQQPLQRFSRRTYADAAAPSPAPKPKKRFRFLRWTWRLAWLSALGLAGELAYSIYDQRTPIEQVQPDPSKKTLVILGALLRWPVGI